MSEPKGPWEPPEGNPALVAARALERAQARAREGSLEKKYDLFMQYDAEFERLLRNRAGKGYRPDEIEVASAIHTKAQGLLKQNEEHFRNLFLKKRKGVDETLEALEWEKVRQTFLRRIDIVLADAQKTRSR